MGTITIHEESWDLEYIHGNVEVARPLDWKPEQLLVTPAEHEHCLVCWWTMHASSDVSIGRGYHSGTRWLCSECYARFILDNELGFYE